MNQQIQLTQLRLQIPAIAKQVKMAQEENRDLQYQIDRFENPAHLMGMLRKPEFSHLKYPLETDLTTISIEERIP